MSRSKKFKYKHGEITLSGFSKEENAQIEAFILGKPEPQVDVVFDESTDSYELKKPEVPLDKTALSYIKIDQNYKAVRVNYNLETGEGKVGVIEDLGTNVNIADHKFSVKMTKEFFK